MQEDPNEAGLSKDTKARTYETIGEAYADPDSNLRRNLDRGERQVLPIKAEVARLMEQGMSGEQAWAEVLRHVTSGGAS